MTIPITTDQQDQYDQRVIVGGLRGFFLEKARISRLERHAQPRQPLAALFQVRVELKGPAEVGDRPVLFAEGLEDMCRT